MDHVSGESTWDKPAGNYVLHIPEEEIDRRRWEAENAALAAAAAQSQSRALFSSLREIKKNAEKEKALRESRAEEHRRYVIWQRAVLDATLFQSFSLCWLKLGEIHPVLYDFH
jgi:glycerol kinase